MFTITTFQAVLKGISRPVFDQCVDRLHADKYCKQFNHWNHLVALVYAQLSNASSLRTLELSFNSHASFHYQFGSGAVHRSTLSDANKARSGVVFDDTAAWLISQLSGKLRREAMGLMYLLDSTSITLKGRQFDRWTLTSRTCHTQGIKLHVLLDAANRIPEWYSFSAANVNDVVQANRVPLQPGALYVFDKGYCDYNWWNRIDAAGALFVTRFKGNAALLVEEKCSIPAPLWGTVVEDEIVRFKRKYPSGKRINQYDKPLRRIVIERPDKSTPLVLATNDLESSPAEIAQRYKERWEIELFFKWIKQHLKIKQFFGRSPNAVHNQIVTALISYLLVALYKLAHGLLHTLWGCLSLISSTLFQPAITETVPRRKRPRRPPDVTLALWEPGL